MHRLTKSLEVFNMKLILCLFGLSKLVLFVYKHDLV